MVSCVFNLWGISNRKRHAFICLYSPVPSIPFWLTFNASFFLKCKCDQVRHTTATISSINDANGNKLKVNFFYSLPLPLSLILPFSLTSLVILHVYLHRKSITAVTVLYHPFLHWNAQKANCFHWNCWGRQSAPGSLPLLSAMYLNIYDPIWPSLSLYTSMASHCQCISGWHTHKSTIACPTLIYQFRWPVWMDLVSINLIHRYSSIRLACELPLISQHQAHFFHFLLFDCLCACPHPFNEMTCFDWRTFLSGPESHCFTVMHSLDHPLIYLFIWQGLVSFASLCASITAIVAVMVVVVVVGDLVITTGNQACFTWYSVHLAVMCVLRLGHHHLIYAPLLTISSPSPCPSLIDELSKYSDICLARTTNFSFCHLRKDWLAISTVIIIITTTIITVC